MSFETDEWANQPDDVTRARPHTVGYEKSILCSMLQDPQEYIDLAIEAGASEEWFYLPAHAALYGVLLDHHQANLEIEFVRLTQSMLDSGKLALIGGPGYMAELYTYSPSPGYFRSHLQGVKDKYILRQLIRATNETVAEIYESPEDPQALVDDAERRIMAIRDGATETIQATVKDDVREIMRDFEADVRGDARERGLMTGFEELDKKTGGMKAGEMHVIAARPSMGKTSLMMNIVENICLDQGKACLVFSAEMPRKDIVSRLGYSRAKFNTGQMLRGHKLVKQELQRIQRAFTEVRESNLIIDDESGPSIGYIAARARREKRKHQIALIAIDYIQLLKSSSKQASFSREREIAEISAGAKAIAKDLGIPVLILAQLNRGPEARTGKSLGVPRMSDLRESGSIEQDADFVGLLYRDKYYAETDEERAALEGKAQLIIAKNRNGPTGSISLTFIEELMRFETGSPWAEEEESEPPRKPTNRKYWQKD